MNASVSVVIEDEGEENTQQIKTSSSVSVVMEDKDEKKDQLFFADPHLVKHTSIGHLKSNEETTLHTLEEFAYSHFRVGQKRSLRRTQSGQTHSKHHHTFSGTSHLWSFSPELIKKPLLKKLLAHSEDIQQKACQSFKDILKYMGDYPTKQHRIETYLTDRIFRYALSNTDMQDEIYCQIIKQITWNKTKTSEERGFELLWLASGLFSCPDDTLQANMELFLESYKQHNPLAAEIKQRLSRTALMGTRQCPPHILEVDAVQKRIPQIFQKVFLPDNSNKVIVVDSNTKTHEICAKVVESSGLLSDEGYGLVLAVDDKVISLANDCFFFDSLYQYAGHVKCHESVEGANDTYQLIFLKTLWIDVIVGQDHRADVTFHYPQELVKYLQGYHKLTFEDAILLGSYVYRANFGSDPFHLDSVKDMILDLVPECTYDEYQREDWETCILKQYSQHLISSSDEAKCYFLKYLSRWPTYGSHFFEVKQINKSGSSENVIVAINHQNILIIANTTKEILRCCPLSSVVCWSYTIKSNYFTFTYTTKNLQLDKFHLESYYSYEMSQLLIDYTSYTAANKDKIHTKHRISILCDTIM